MYEGTCEAELQGISIQNELQSMRGLESSEIGLRFTKYPKPNNSYMTRGWKRTKIGITEGFSQNVHFFKCNKFHKLHAADKVCLCECYCHTSLIAILSFYQHKGILRPAYGLGLQCDF